MADKKQSAFTEDTTPTLDDFLTTIETTSGKNRKVKIENFLDLISANITPTQWTEDQTVTYSVGSNYNLGNRIFEIDTDQDASVYLSKGMRFKIDPVTTAPTQCTDLESGSTQYALKTSPTALGLTTTASFEAWIRIESLTGSAMNIVATRSGSVAYSIFRVGATGTLEIYATASSATSDSLVSSRILPTGEWVHVAGQMTINSGGKLYINGAEVSATYTNGTTTAFGNTGDLAVGARPDTGAELFDGKISDVRVWSDIRTESEIRDNMYKQLAGNEAGLVAYHKLNGDFNDYQTNQSANNLTGQNSAVATSTDHPFKDTVYGVIVDITSSTVTVFCPSGYGIPNGSLENAYYSAQKMPYGFPGDVDDWTISSLYAAASSTSSTSYATNGMEIILLGHWDLSILSTIRTQRGSTTFSDGDFALSSSTSSVSDGELNTILYSSGATGTIESKVPWYAKKRITVSTPTTYSVISKVSSGTMTATISTSDKTTAIVAVCPYI